MERKIPNLDLVTSSPCFPNLLSTCTHAFLVCGQATSPFFFLLGPTLRTLQSAQVALPARWPCCAPFPRRLSLQNATGRRAGPSAKTRLMRRRGGRTCGCPPPCTPSTCRRQRARPASRAMARVRPGRVRTTSLSIHGGKASSVPLDSAVGSTSRDRGCEAARAEAAGPSMESATADRPEMRHAGQQTCE